MNSELRGVGRIVRYEGLLDAAAGALRRGGVRPDPRRDLLWALWLKHSATTREQPAAKCVIRRPRHEFSFRGLAIDLNLKLDRRMDR